MKQFVKDSNELTNFSRWHKKRRILSNSFIFFKSQHNYCPLVCMCYSRKNKRKRNKLHERCFRIMNNDKQSSFMKHLSSSAGHKEFSYCNIQRQQRFISTTYTWYFQFSEQTFNLRQFSVFLSQYWTLRIMALKVSYFWDQTYGIW